MAYRVTPAQRSEYDQYSPLVDSNPSQTYSSLDLSDSLSRSTDSRSLNPDQIELVTDSQDSTQEKTQNIFQRVWSNMSGLSKGLSICTLSLYFWGYMIGFALGLIPETPKQEPVTVVGQAETLFSTRAANRLDRILGPLIPHLETDGIVSVKPHLLPMSPTQFTCAKARVEKDHRQTVLLKEICECDKTITSYTNSLGVRAAESGLGAEDFIAAIRSGASLESMGLKYYRFFQSMGEIQQDNKPFIEEYFSAASEAQVNRNALLQELGTLRREILEHHSATDTFTSMVAQGTPYTLEINSSLVSTMFEINVQLANWGGQGTIQLSAEDSAIVVQQYLVRLAESRPFTSLGENLGDFKLETVPGTQTVHAKGGNPREIHSTRTVQLTGEEGKVWKTYQWNETIRIFPEEGNRVEITREVQEIK